MAKDLLIEIGTEELPPVGLRELANAFGQAIAEDLNEHGIDHGECIEYCSPRRLAVLVRLVAEQQEGSLAVRRGPSVSASFNADGTPTKAAMGFAHSCGVEVSELEQEATDKGEWLVFRKTHAGRQTSELIPPMAERALGRLPIAKRMRWGCGDAEFVRPVHWVCVLFGNEIVSGEILGITIGNTTRGHRFHAPEAIAVVEASSYAHLLRTQGFVEPSFERRRHWIVEQVQRIAQDERLNAELPPRLLDEVTALVEWPQAIPASFDTSFLAVPGEVLIETMQGNQKYFPLRNQDGSLSARFIVIANIESICPDEVRKGNERVIRPRFADAKFFWEQDLQHPLSDAFERLKTLVFQDRLGSVADRSARTVRLASEIARLLGEPTEFVERTAYLAKCDLVSTMVREFPALQGTMGRYYAQHTGEHPVVCVAIEEHYLPRFAGDALPSNSCGTTVALADKLDTLTGIFGVGLRPTGTKDPYGLRRATIGALRLLIETPLHLDLKVLLKIAEAGFDRTMVPAGTSEEVWVYMMDRLVGYYQDQGIPQDIVDAVAATGDTLLSRFDTRVRAVAQFRETSAGKALAAATKRIRNLLAKGRIASTEASGGIDPDLFVDETEEILWQEMKRVAEDVRVTFEHGDFFGVLERLASLAPTVGAFFDRVLVMAEDSRIRDNRLRLVEELQRLCVSVADISLLS
jgi:glycyl-tRNA synthetase beta chain